MTLHGRLVSALWLVVLGSLLVAFTLTWAALNEMHRTYPPVIKTNAGFRFTALDPDTGLPVTRAQWIDEATR